MFTEQTTNLQETNSEGWKWVWQETEQVCHQQSVSRSHQVLVSWPGKTTSLRKGSIDELMNLFKCMLVSSPLFPGIHYNWSIIVTPKVLPWKVSVTKRQSPGLHMVFMLKLTRRWSFGSIVNRLATNNTPEYRTRSADNQNVITATNITNYK